MLRRILTAEAAIPPSGPAPEPNKPGRHLLQALSLGVIVILGFLLARSPESVPRNLCRLLGWLTWQFSSRRQVVLSNLHHAFPEKDPAWRTRVARENLRRMHEMFLLAVAGPHMSKARWRRMMHLPEATRARLHAERGGRGFVFLVPHATLMESLVMLPIMLPELPVCATFYRPLDFPPLERYVRRARARFGARLLSRREGLLQARDILQAGGVVAVLFDQNVLTAGGPTLFFDRVCSATDLPAILARKYNVPCFYLGSRRTAFWACTAEVEPLPSPEDPGRLIFAAHAVLEAKLRESEDRAADWFWAHQRWKIHQRPSERLNLNFKKSFLEAALAERGLATLPRMTRLAFLLPGDASAAAAFLELLPAVRRGRPDARVTVLRPPGLSLAAPEADAVLDIPEEPSQRRSFFQGLQEQYLDTLFVLTQDASMIRVARHSRIRQFWGWHLTGEKPLAGLRHSWEAPVSLRQDPAALWRAFLLHYGLPPEALSHLA